MLVCVVRSVKVKSEKLSDIQEFSYSCQSLQVKVDTIPHEINRNDTLRTRVSYCLPGYRDIKIMVTPGSSFTPTPISHEDNLEVGHPPRADALRLHHGSKLRGPSPEVHV
ncbi:hypothetical protein TNCV_4059851 [Trichonephila clavipes]|nr:hypothetical protein TNCV_4059851 [Trichonephila clavipes]